MPAVEEQLRAARSRTGPGVDLSMVLRLAALAALGIAELFIITFFFFFPTELPSWANPIAYGNKIARMAPVVLLVWLALIWPKRAQLLASVRSLGGKHAGMRYAALHAVNFAIVLLATVALSSLAATAPSPPWGWFCTYCALLLTNALSLARLAAPWRLWSQIAVATAGEALAAVSAGIFVVVLSQISQDGWETLAGATLTLSHALLSLYEPNVTLDAASKSLGAEDFKVLILPACSGYEGIGLVLAATTLYLGIFRRQLKFPNALLLIPIGVTVIWLLNVVRIAALISIGAHVSPAIAFNGFHSQAGWMAFLAVTVGMMVVASRWSFFANVASRPAMEALSTQSSDRRLLAFLAPFMALMASSILASAFAPHDHWLYPVKVLAVGATVWMFRDVYRTLVREISPWSVLAGAAVGVVWAMTDPAAGVSSNLEQWLAAQSLSVAALWIVIRATGAIVLVPIAEELAFRGYFLRALASRHFETVTASQISLVAILVSSILFGFLHERWLAGALAGVVYALVMVRTGRVSDAIAAHMASNAVIVAWAIVLGQWSLL